MILLVDTETTGFDPKKDGLIEVGIGRFDEEVGKLVDARSWLLRRETNEAEHINHIPAAILAHGVERDGQYFESGDARCVVAHNASFDSQWVAPVGRVPPWVCSLKDIKWPRGGGKLETLALNHGVAVVPGHRALYDVLTLARVFEVMPHFGTTAKALIDAALVPKSEWRSLQKFGDNGLAQAAGFAWDAARRGWFGKFTDEEANAIAEQRLFTISRVRG